MSTYRQDYEREVARLRAMGGGWAEEQIESIARRNVAFARGPKTTVVCVAAETTGGRFRAVCRDRAGQEIASGTEWLSRGDAEHQARELAFARGLNPVQS